MSLVRPNRIVYLDDYRAAANGGNSAVFASARADLASGVSSSVTSAAIPRWNEAVLNRLGQLSALQIGWDGFTASPVRPDVAFFASQFLFDVMSEDSKPPTILPLHSGGLQIEWHVDAADVEVSVTGPFEIAAWSRDRTTGEETEFVMTTDFKIFEPVMKFVGGDSSKQNAAA